MPDKFEMPATVDIAIIGSGFSGICAAIKLLQAGRNSIVILEKADDLGGTWRDNKYPGCACDVPSHLYSFSFEPNPYWSRTYSPQAEINAYIAHCARKYGVYEKIAFGHEVARRTYIDQDQAWDIEIKGRASLRARIIISAMGSLHQPHMPEIPGIDTFQGEAFHSAQWPGGFDPTGKRIAVIGTGASTIQILPEISKTAKSVVVFQRTPAWVIPRHDEQISNWRQKLYAKTPLLQRLHRTYQYWRMESRAIGFSLHPRLMKNIRRWGEKNIRKAISDDTVVRSLIPDYLPGCKRILMSNDYYPALARPNVTLKTEAANKITKDAIVSKDGEKFGVDAIVFGTGFKFGEKIESRDVLGKNGLDLAASWEDKGQEAYFGMAVHGFPNLFFLMGPNTGLGHNSIVFMIEAQVAAIVRLLAHMEKQNARSIEVHGNIQAAYNDELQKLFARTIWMSGCNSWYRDGQNGKVIALWPGFSFDFRRQTRRIHPSAFSLKS